MENCEHCQEKIQVHRCALCIQPWWQEDRRGLAFSTPALSWLCEVPGEAEISIGGWSPKLVLIPVFAGAGPCVLGTLCFVLTHAAERVWQRAGAVMVQKAAGRGCGIPRGPAIMFPNMPVREAVLLAMGFLAEMICLSGCSINGLNCLAVLVGAAVCCRVLTEHRKGVKVHHRISLG